MTPPASLAEYEDRLRAVGLGDHVPALTRLARTSLRLVPDATAPAAEQAPLRLGGRPILQADHPWPRRDDGVPLSLIAQLDLAVLAAAMPPPGGAAAAPGDIGLPDQGTVAFFYDAVEQSVWGFDPADVDGWAVVPGPAGGRGSELAASLREFPEDLTEPGRFRPVALAAQPELTVPALGSHDVEAILGQAWSEPYAWVLGDGPDPVTHRFLGHPNPVQGDMQLECQLASHGVAVGDGDYLGLSRTAELAPGAADWRLLLQVDSEPAAAMMWGDVGRLYWWITHEHLAEGLWEGSWFVLQCC